MVFKRTGVNIVLIIVSLLIAVGYGKFVYPANPLIVWLLLFICWLCFRLHRRARALFESQNHPVLGRREEDMDYTSPR